MATRAQFQLLPPLQATRSQDRGRGIVNDLISAAQLGDDRAFRSLYEVSVDRVYALCLRLAADPGLAEELTQDVFVRAWEKLKTFKGESAFSTWLHRLAVNVVLSEKRARGRREKRVFTSGELEDLERPGMNPTPAARMDLEQAIASLPPGARAVFVLHDIEGYQHEEIAEMSGMASGTSKAQLFRARRLLREMLDR